MVDRERVRELYVEAAALSPEDVPGYLDRACGSDADLRREVESLLSAAAARPQFLASPTSPSPGIGDAGGEVEGATIGRYHLLQEIGRGGFGTVYAAEQSEPVRRRVALKIIKLGMDTRGVIARFEAERQALALMDHANIAKVFDAGATETGRPYFVMELVKGEPVTAYCDRHNLSISERLGVFVQVCHAVQHAHSKGVIHRDIKPGNVLVSTEDGRPHVKVIDFGIAKATQQHLTEKTIFTDFRQFIGTPEYMSPEQAVGSLGVDTRTDVYSLGVLLYELLTGATPFDGRSLRSAAYAEIQRIIREVDPPKPSTRVSTLGEGLAEVASQRRTEAARLSPLLRGDLDWIVMRCLEKDRARRYATSDALAAEIEAFLRGDPVTAVPPSAAYRFRKFATRNRALLTASGAVLGVIVLGVFGTTWGMFTAMRAERVANQERDSATVVRDFLAQTFQGVAPQVSRGRDTTLLASLMENAAARLESGELAGNARAEADLRVVIGEVNAEIARYEQARLVIAPLGDGTQLPGMTRVRLLLLRANLALAASNIEETEQFLAESQRVLESQSEDEPALRGRVLAGLAEAAAARNLTARQEDLAAQAVRAAEATTPRDHETLAARLLSLGRAIRAQGREEEAVRVLGRALLTLDEDPRLGSVTGESPVRVQVLLARAAIYGQQYTFDLAERDLKEALLHAERIFPADHPALLEIQFARANTSLHMGRYEQGLVEMQAVIDGQRWVYGADSIQIADSLAVVAFVHYSSRRWQQALDALEAIQRIREKHMSAEDAAAFSEWTMMVDCLDSLGRITEALELARRSCTLCLKSAEPSSDVALLARNTLLLSLYFAREDREAADEGRRLLADCAAWRPSDLPAWLHLTYAVTGESLVNAGDPAEADESVRLLRTCVEVRTAKFSDRDFRVTRARLQLGRAIVMQAVRRPPDDPEPTREALLASFAEAESLLVPNFESLVAGIKLLDPPHRGRWVELAGRAIVTLYEAWDADAPNSGRDELARQWRERLESTLKAVSPNDVSPSPR